MPNVRACRMRSAMLTILVTALVPVTPGNAQAPQARTAELISKAKRGDPEALFGLAVLHDIGAEGVRRDPAEAARLLQHAADAGHVRSKIQLGRMYQVGVGVPQDAAKALALFTDAARNGSVEGQFQLALASLDGLGGKRDPVEALRWMAAAAKAGHQEAQLTVGIMLQTGTGGQKNEFTARRYLRQAADGPDPEISRKADELLTKLDERLLDSSAFGRGSEAAILFAISAGLAILILGEDQGSARGNDYWNDLLEKRRKWELKRHYECTMAGGWWDGTVCHPGE